MITIIKLIKSTKRHHIFYVCVVGGAGIISCVLPHITAEVMALSFAPIIGEVTRKQLNKKNAVKGAGNKKHHAQMHHEVHFRSTVNELHGSE